MNPEAQRIAIAEACGWTFKEKDGQLFSYDPASKVGITPHTWELPDYLNDLNAMHAAEKVLADTVKREYIKQLVAVVNESEWSKWPTAHATAAQRAEAFLRTIGRWTE